MARLLLAELESEERWAALLATEESEELLAELADEALADHRAGRTKPLDPGRHEEYERLLRSGTTTRSRIPVLASVPGSRGTAGVSEAMALSVVG